MSKFVLTIVVTAEGSVTVDQMVDMLEASGLTLSNASFAFDVQNVVTVDPAYRPEIPECGTCGGAHSPDCDTP